LGKRRRKKHSVLSHALTTLLHRTTKRNSRVALVEVRDNVEGPVAFSSGSVFPESRGERGNKMPVKKTPRGKALNLVWTRGEKRFQRGGKI